MLHQAFEKHLDVNGLVLLAIRMAYQMHPYHGMLKDIDIVQSMSRKRNCLDNSPSRISLEK